MLNDRMSVSKVLFLDDDPVVRILRLALCDALSDPWIRDYFAPEVVDLAPLADAVQGLRRSDGATVFLSGTGPDALPEATTVVFRRGEVDAAFLDRHPALRFIQRLGERPQGIDLAETRRRGVRVSCLPRRTLAYTAEHSLLLMLALGKRLLEGDRAVRLGSTAGGNAAAVDGSAYNWAGLSGARGLAGSTLGIVGLGEVGSLVARMANAFGMTVLYYKPRRATPEQEASVGASYTSLDDLLTRADYVALNAANTPENIGMAGQAFFSHMKSSAYFVNTSRGRLVDEDALYNALTNGSIAGAGLDVHGVEPRRPGDRFAALANVILTPHVAGGARSGLVDELAVLARNCHAALQGGAVAFELVG